MPDWTKSMQQTYEYYTVDPGTWEDKNKISTVKSCSISYDDNSDTLGSASFEITGDIGEQYIRPYLVTNQNGIIERFPLGTFLAQTPSTSFPVKPRAFCRFFTAVRVRVPIIPSICLPSELSRKPRLTSSHCSHLIEVLGELG